MNPSWFSEVRDWWYWKEHQVVWSTHPETENCDSPSLAAVHLLKIMVVEPSTRVIFCQGKAPHPPKRI